MQFSILRLLLPPKACKSSAYAQIEEIPAKRMNSETPRKTCQQLTSQQNLTLDAKRAASLL